MTESKALSAILRNIGSDLSSHQSGNIFAATAGDESRDQCATFGKTAAAHPLVTGAPPPQALVVKLGPDSFTFELRAWTDQSELWMQIRSELAIAVSSTLTAENSAIK